MVTVEKTVLGVEEIDSSVKISQLPIDITTGEDIPVGYYELELYGLSGALGNHQGTFPPVALRGYGDTCVQLSLRAWCGCHMPSSGRLPQTYTASPNRTSF